MVARLIEGWESSTAAADYLGKWTALSGAGLSIAAGSGRFGNGLRLATASTANASRVFDAQATWIVGFAVRFAAFPGGSEVLCSFLDGATVHCGVALATDGTLFAWRGTVATVLGTAALALSPTAWYYLEVKATIHDTAGVVVVRVNGAVVINVTTADTRNAGNASATTVRLGVPAAVVSGPVTDVDDVYVFDATGGVNSDFAGDCKVVRVLPTGAGGATAWTPSAGANWQCVDDVPPNGDTDYVSSATAGQTDSYAFGDLAVTGAVAVVQATVQARKDDAGSRSLALVARPGSTDRVGATQAVGDSYALYPQLWDTNPDTAAPWTVADVNGAAFGVQLIAEIAEEAPMAARVSQQVVEVLVQPATLRARVSQVVVEALYAVELPPPPPAVGRAFVVTAA